MWPVKCPKSKLSKLLSEHVSFHSFIFSVYWAPNMCRKHANHRDELVNITHSINLVFGTMVLCWSNVPNLCKGSWSAFNSKPNRSIYFYKGIQFSLNNIRTRHTQAWWELDHRTTWWALGCLCWCWDHHDCPVPRGPVCLACLCGRLSGWNVGFE